MLSLAYLVEVVLLADPASSPWLGVTMLGCLALSSLQLVAGAGYSHPCSLGLASLTMVQGSWLLHSAQVSTLSPLHYSWHLTGVFIANITITAAIRFVMIRVRPTGSNSSAGEQNMKQKHTNLTKTVGKTIDTLGEVKLDIISVDKVPVNHKSREDIEIMNVLHSIDKMVNEPQKCVEKEEETITDSEKSSFKERISPLEEFNTLFKHADCVRKSIKLKESHIV